MAVIDNLTSTSTTDSLSANMGRQLKFEIDNAVMRVSANEASISANGTEIASVEARVTILEASTSGIQTNVSNLDSRVTILENSVMPTPINVVDNLTSTSTTDALSANQGRILNNYRVTIDGEITQIKSDIIDNANNITSLDSRVASLEGGAGQITVEDLLTSTSTVNALSANQGKVLKDAQDALDLRITDIETNGADAALEARVAVLEAKPDEVVDIEDVLTSTRTDAALSANQGKVLKDEQDSQQLSLDDHQLRIDNLEAVAFGEVGDLFVDNLDSTETNRGLSANQGRILKEMIEEGGGSTGSGVEVGSIVPNGKHFNGSGWFAIEDEDFTFSKDDYGVLFANYFGDAEEGTDYSQAVFTQSNIVVTTTNNLQSVSHIIDGYKRWFIFRAISGDVIMYEDYSNQFDIDNANTPGDISNYSSLDYVAGTSRGFFTTTFSYSGNHNELCYIKFDTNAATAQLAVESMDRISTKTNFFSELMGNSFHFGDVNISTVETSDYIYMYANENGTVAETLSNIIYVNKSDVDANIDAHNDPFFDMSIYKYVNISGLIGSYTGLIGNTARITVAFDNNGNMAACNWDTSVSEPIVFANVFSETMVNTVTNPTANDYTSLIPCYSIDGQVYLIANGYPSIGGTWIYDMSGNLITGTVTAANGCAYFAKGLNPIIFGNPVAGFSPETAMSHYKTGLDMDSATWTDIDTLINNKISSHEYAICNSGFSNSRWGRIATLNTCRMQREDLIQFCRSGSIGYIHSIDVSVVAGVEPVIKQQALNSEDKKNFLYVGEKADGTIIRPDGQQANISNLAGDPSNPANWGTIE